MNTKETQEPDKLFVNWAKTKGLDTSRADYKNYTGEGRGFAFNDYMTNLFYQVYERANANPNIDDFELEVIPLEFSLDKTETGLYKNRYTSRAKQLYEVVCGKYETEAQIKKSQEVI